MHCKLLPCNTILSIQRSDLTLLLLPGIIARFVLTKFVVIVLLTDLTPVGSCQLSFFYRALGSALTPHDSQRYFYRRR